MPSTGLRTLDTLFDDVRKQPDACVSELVQKTIRRVFPETSNWAATNLTEDVLGQIRGGIRLTMAEPSVLAMLLFQARGKNPEEEAENYLQGVSAAVSEPR